MYRNIEIFKKIFTYLFIIVFSLSHFNNVKTIESIHTTQNSVNKSFSVIRCEDKNAICTDAIIDTQLASDYIQTLHKKTGTTLYRFSKKSNGVSFILIPVFYLICNTFLNKKENRIIDYIATTFSMRWIIKYIHYKNGVKHMVSSVFS